MREQGGRPNAFGETVRYVFDYRFPQLVITVPIIGILFFTVLPIVFMILLAFTNFTRENMPPAELIDWHGFKTFGDMFRIKAWSGTFYGVTMWTFSWAFFATFTCFFGGFAIALLVQQQDVRFKSFWRVLYILPYAIPAFVSTLIMRNIFNGQFGPVNQYLTMLGFEKVPWLTDAVWAKFTILLVNLWLGFPISMLMVIGILSTIPRDMYEAADIDGASAFKKLRFITFPAVMYSMAPILVLQLALNINNFNLIYLLTGGNPVNADYRFAGSTDILITWLYKLSIDQGQYNFASVILFLSGFVGRDVFFASGHLTVQRNLGSGPIYIRPLR
ncbi:MAG TPA: sugar ABC transporter permease [Paenibacillus sp.]|uniref:carbohydrate ABC transporter permease n=1 Tax=Paenibacillus sp. TaxID=58172 RepID=UPI0028D63965|nr:sugar ABC transporter permease [Paenibacillus sp.]HUC92421.1 sugar ABC transporter permease [Paenibacillus sp.]